jgi:nucleoside phosphorylase
MRKYIILLGICAGLVASVSSADIGISTDLMQSIEDTNKSLASNISINDAKASTADANDLTNMFGQVETFFVQKGDAQDAVDLAKKSKELTMDITKFVAAKNYEAATNAATTVSRNCRTCHTFYKKE